MRVAVFVIDGHDIDLDPNAVGAAREIEGYDAKNLDYFGADGPVYKGDRRRTRAGTRQPASNPRQSPEPLGPPAPRAPHRAGMRRQR